MSIASSKVTIDVISALKLGDLDGAKQLLEPVLNTAPDSLQAARLMGKIAEKRGDLGEAERWYQAALAMDARDGELYGGLGRIARSRGEQQAALAYCQVAWELAPWDVCRREQLVEIAREVLGADGQLQWTRAALANQHLAQGRLERAALEFRRALEGLPGRVDLQAGLAQAVWMIGDDLSAARMARDLLADRPRLIQGLVLLTDIEQRRGELELAAGHGAHLRQIDPDGVLSASYAELRPDAEREALLAGSRSLLVTEETAVETEPVEVAPVTSESPASPVASGGVRPIGEELLPATFPTAPDITPAYTPVMASVTAEEPAADVADVVEEAGSGSDAVDKPDPVPDEAGEPESPAWPVSHPAPPSTKLPSSDAIAEMLGLLREERHIKE